MRARATLRAHAGAAVLSCVATMAQILVVAATVQPLRLAQLWLPALAGGCVAGAAGWWGVRGARHLPGQGRRGRTVPELPPDTPMFKLRDALIIAALLRTGIQAGVQLLTAWQGDAGMLAGDPAGGTGRCARCHGTAGGAPASGGDLPSSSSYVLAGACGQQVCGGPGQRGLALRPAVAPGAGAHPGLCGGASAAVIRGSAGRAG